MFCLQTPRLRYATTAPAMPTIAVTTHVMMATLVARVAIADCFATSRAEASAAAVARSVAVIPRSARFKVCLVFIRCA